MIENIPFIEEYLGSVARLRIHSKPRPENWKYDGAEDFVLKEGVRFTERDFDVQQLPKRQCFDNCFRLAVRNEGLYYCEGWAMGVIPIHHAWLCDIDGRIYDPTWWGDRVSEDSYIGVPFSLEFVMEQVDKNDRAGLLFPDGHMINLDIMEGRAGVIKLNV